MRPAYVMTINKAQGQTLENVGIFLQKPVFARGQLYTSLSRAGAPKGVAVLAPRDEDGIMTTLAILFTGRS
jgi:ATP-dependent DNA helicase PIF1